MADGPDVGTAPDLSVVRSKGNLTTLEYIGAGNYRLDFAEIRNASEECAYNATLADVSGNGSTEISDIRGEIMVHPDAAGQITVLTFNSAVTAHDPGSQTRPIPRAAFT